MPQYKLAISPGETGYNQQQNLVQAVDRWPHVDLSEYPFRKYFVNKEIPSAEVRAYVYVPGVSTGRVISVPFTAESTAKIVDVMGRWDKAVRQLMAKNPKLSRSEIEWPNSRGAVGVSEFRAEKQTLGIELNGVVQQARKEIEGEVEKAKEKAVAMTTADVEKRYPGILNQVLMGRPDSVRFRGTPAHLSKLLGKFKTLYLGAFKDPSEASDSMAEFVRHAGPGQKVLKLECDGVAKAALYVLADKDERAEIEAIARGILKKKVSSAL